VTGPVKAIAMPATDPPVQIRPRSPIKRLIDLSHIQQNGNPVPLIALLVHAIRTGFAPH